MFGAFVWLLIGGILLVIAITLAASIPGLAMLVASDEALVGGLTLATLPVIASAIAFGGFVFLIAGILLAAYAASDRAERNMAAKLAMAHSAEAVGRSDLVKLGEDQQPKRPERIEPSFIR